MYVYLVVQYSILYSTVFYLLYCTVQYNILNSTVQCSILYCLVWLSKNRKETHV